MSAFFSLAGEPGKNRCPNPNTLITGSTRTLVEYDRSMPLGRGRRRLPTPAAAGVLEHRSRPRNTTRPDALTRGLSAAIAGRHGRAGPRGCHGGREFLPESEEEADDDEEARVRSGCAHGCCCCRCFGGVAAAALFLQSLAVFLDMRWRRLATGAERVRRGGRDGGGGRRAFLPESHEEADEDEEESRDRSGRECASRRPRAPSVRPLVSPTLGFFVTRRRRSRHRRPAHRGARGDAGSEGGSSTHGGAEQVEVGFSSGRRGTSFPSEKSSSAAESAATAAGMRNSKSPSPSSASTRGAGKGAMDAWNEKRSGEVTAATAVAITGVGGALTLEVVVVGGVSAGARRGRRELFV